MEDSLFLTGVMLGLGAAAPIGPVNVEVARRSIRGGVRAGVMLGCGAVTVDTVYVVVAGLGVRPLLWSRGAVLGLAVVAAGLLAYLGIQCLLAARKEWAREIGEGRPEGVRRNYLTGLLMTAANPMTLAFWFAVVPTLVRGSGVDLAGGLPSAAAGVACGALAWVGFFASLTAWAGSFARRVTSIVADVAGGVLLIGFAALTLYLAAGRG